MDIGRDITAEKIKKLLAIELKAEPTNKNIFRLRALITPQRLNFSMKYFDIKRSL